MSESKLDRAIAKIKSICADSNGRSEYFSRGEEGYQASMAHYFESSSDEAVGAVQPGSEEDLAEIVKVIADAQVPFAVKGGGHSTNPGFSSTTGIQIYLVRLNNITVDAPNKLVRVEAGCLFDELYSALEPYELGTVGGFTLTDVGVAGWMLGGGYSAKTSRYGLGVDNVTSVKVVLPDGTIKVASETDNPDLFFAVRGGGNNYGIVTELTLKAYSQPKGSLETVTHNFKNSLFFDAIKQAFYSIIEMQNNQVYIEAVFMHSISSGQLKPEVTLTVNCMTDGLSQTDPFKELTKIPRDDSTTSMSYSTNSFRRDDTYRSSLHGTYDNPRGAPTHLEYLDFCEFGKALRVDEPPRGRWGSVMVDQFTPSIIDEIEKESYELARGLAQYSGAYVGIKARPFTMTMFDNATESAWPHEKGKPNCPIIVYTAWWGEEHDAYWINTMKDTLDTLRGMVHKERPNSIGLPFFFNAAFAEGTTVEDLYCDNLPRLKELRKKFDPNGVMDYTGGFRIPFE